MVMGTLEYSLSSYNSYNHLSYSLFVNKQFLKSRLQTSLALGAIKLLHIAIVLFLLLLMVILLRLYLVGLLIPSLLPLHYHLSLYVWSIWICLL